MQIENFKIFADLVETKSFSKAAKLNGITQSAVSQQARAMERNFKTLMIDRSQKQFNLTREGQRIYEAAKEILHVYEKLESELQEMKKVISGTIRISTIYSIGLHELPPYVKRFLQEFPSVNVRIEYRRSNLVYEDILHNAVDFGLVAFPQKQRQIEMIPFRNDRLVMITHPNTRWPRAPRWTSRRSRATSSSASTPTSRPARRWTRSSATTSSRSRRSWSSTTSRR